MTMDAAVDPDEFPVLKPLEMARTRFGIDPPTVYAAAPTADRAALKLRA
ncbi:hypothetical protein [Brevundimonas sp.]